jgi:hypothetical protein
MALNSSQKINRIWAGLPFGDGILGNTTISSDPNTRSWCTGTSGSTTLTVGSTSFANGDLVLLHRSYGSSNLTDQNWEVNYVASGGGTTTLTLLRTLAITYPAGGQIVKIPRYNNLTISSGFGGHAYGATDTTNVYAMGGLNVLAVRGTLTLNAVINQNGYYGILNNVGSGGPVATHDDQGWPNLPKTWFKWWYDNATSGGHVGAPSTGAASNGRSGGNSNSGMNYNVGNTNIYNGGGGGGDGYNSSGASGGHASIGGINSGPYENGTNTGGGAAGTTDLASLHFGGGGGGGRQLNLDRLASGASGGGAWIIFAQNITIGSSGGIQVNGGQSQASPNVPPYNGGNGAGGSALIVCNTATLNTAKITATGGAGHDYTGSGSVGRIAVHHSGPITGTSSPTFTDVTDTTLKQQTFTGMI